MTFVILFEDNPGPGADIRKAHMADHLAFLERHAAQITAAGPLKSTQGQAAGGLWLVEAESADAADALVKADPFWPAGLRKSVRILEWQQVFADGRCLI